MKTALLHYWLTNFRGGEKVLAEFCSLWPEADIFTHAWNPDKMGAPFAGHRITESFIGRLPGARKHCQKYLPLMPSAIKRLDLSGYDLLISSESGPIKGVRKAPGARHICYCHSPMRYLYDMYEEYYRSSGVVGKMAMRLFRNYLTRYDQQSANGVDDFIVNSRFVGERVKRVYNRDSTVIYPPVETEFFQAVQEPKQDYYLFVGQLIAYKHPELAVEACRRMKRRLIVVGDGPLRGEDDVYIRYAGRADGEELRRLYAGARALIFPGIEDFGIVPLEAQAAGTPVIALGVGGALETVRSGETGVFFDQCNADSLADAMKEFERLTFDRATLRRQADRFGSARFRREMSDFVQRRIGGAAK